MKKILIVCGIVVLCASGYFIYKQNSNNYPVSFNGVLVDNTADFVYQTNDADLIASQFISNYDPYIAWDSYSDDIKEAIAKVYGTTASAVSAAAGGNAAPLAQNPAAVLCAVLNPGIIDKTICGNWDYSHNYYKVWDDYKADRNFPSSYRYWVYYSNEAYQNIFLVCKKFKWDFLAVISKWRWQSGNALYLENNAGGQCCGLAGQITSQDGRLANVARVFTQDELNSWKNTDKTRLRNQNYNGGLTAASVPELTIGDVLSVAKSGRGNNKMWTSQEDLNKAGFLFSISDNAELNRAKEKYNVICEMACLLTSTHGGVKRGIDNLDASKVREICFKDGLFTDADMDFLFADFVKNVDTIYTRFDNLDEYKKKAYIFLKHWSSGSSDSGQSYIPLNEICNYITNNNFNEAEAKLLLGNAFAYDIWATACNVTAEASFNRFKVARDTITPIYNGTGIERDALYKQSSGFIAGIDYSKICNSLGDPGSIKTDAAGYNELTTKFALADIYSSDFSSYLSSSPLYKGILFAFEGFTSGKLNATKMQTHGLGHACYQSHYIYKNRKDLGCSQVIAEGKDKQDNPVRSIVGGSTIHYHSAIDWWLNGGKIQVLY